MKKLLLLSALLIFACTDDEGNPCVYEPTLTTEAATNITDTSATLNGVISITSQNCEAPNNTEQGFVYSTEIQPTLEDIQVNVNGTSISTTIEGLEPNTTYYVRAFLTNTLGDFYGDEISFITTDIPCDVVYLDDNGITIKACEDAVVSEVGVVNGVEYTVVDRAMLAQMLENNEDVSKACTTKITDMGFNTEEQVSFFGTGWNTEIKYPFNQDISNWDVSNVTDMSYLFFWTTFNQDISNWDVSSVTNMNSMFRRSDFNQPIGNWEVSNVTTMSNMFSGSSDGSGGYWEALLNPFNQPIGYWDVSNVIDFNSMFYLSAFNQPIGDWDVSSVTNMQSMFSGAFYFNQPIGDWDVSNVTTMERMFMTAVYFNQPIGDWDTSSLINVVYMFRIWPAINNVPLSYMSFNQDLSNWDTETITNCTGFYFDTQWTLPQPNFTNCTP